MRIFSQKLSYIWEYPFEHVPLETKWVVLYATISLPLRVVSSTDLDGFKPIKKILNWEEGWSHVLRAGHTVSSTGDIRLSLGLLDRSCRRRAKRYVSDNFSPGTKTLGRLVYILVALILSSYGVVCASWRSHSDATSDSISVHSMMLLTTTGLCAVLSIRRVVGFVDIGERLLIK